MPSASLGRQGSGLADDRDRPRGPRSCAASGETARLDFAAPPVLTPAAARRALVALAEKARSAAAARIADSLDPTGGFAAIALLAEAIRAVYPAV